MSSNYTGSSATFPATVPVTDDADPRNTTAILAASAEALADRTSWLKAGLDPLINNHAFTEAGGVKTMLADMVVTAAGKFWTFDIETFFSQPVDFTSTTATFAAVQLDGPTTSTGLIVMSGAGHLRRRTAVVTDAAGIVPDLTITASDVHVANALSTSSVATAIASGAAVGDEIEIINFDATHSLTVFDTSPASLAVLKKATGFPRSVRLIFNPDASGLWRVAARAANEP